VVVVPRALLLVRQDFVGLLDLNKALGGPIVADVLVGMVEEGVLAEAVLGRKTGFGGQFAAQEGSSRSFDLVLVCSHGQAQDCVRKCSEI
jgi:hypothetical protein